MQANLGLRLVVLRVLVLSLVVTLGARLYYLQILDQQKLTQTATKQHTREVVLAAPRGAIVDDRGRPLVANRVSLVVSVNRSELLAEPDRGAAVLRRLAPLVRIPAAELARRITPCQRGVPKPCWNGSPYQPVPVLTDTTPDVVLRIAEHREDFPGVTASAQTLREYPGRSLAAHTLGYVGPVTQEELDNAAAASQTAAGRATGQADLHRIDLVGRSGLEARYDADLRGRDGIRRVSVDNRGTVLGTQSETPPVQGDTLVTSLDRTVQALTEKALAAEIAKRRTETDSSTGRRFAAPSGAAVVLDPRTGRIIALASYPSYDPTVFVGGISQRELTALTDPRAGVPLVSRAVQGQFAPGSTFKLVSASAEVSTGRASLAGSYPCPGSLRVGNRTKTNFEGKGIAGAISMATALAKSCDTFFYAFAMQDWYADQARVDRGQRPVEAQQRYARAYGFGAAPEIDLPDGEQTTGRIVDRAFLRQRWEASKAQYCADGRRGYPEVADPARRTFLTRLAQENCTDGWRFRLGDAADLAIGQGETTVSPLQLAVAYAALVNGGTVWEPTLGRAVLGPDGRLVREIKPKARGRVPVSPQLLAYMRDSLAFTPANGASGSVAFADFPLDKVLVGGKTGTAEVFGKQDTSWFASWAPAGQPRFVVVGMIEQAGLGARAAAPLVRQIYEGIFGLAGKPAALPSGVPPTAVPRIAVGRGGAGRGSHPGASGPAGAPGQPSAPGTPGATPVPTGTAPTSEPAPAPRRTGGSTDLVSPVPSATVWALPRRTRRARPRTPAGHRSAAGHRDRRDTCRSWRAAGVRRVSEFVRGGRGDRAGTCRSRDARPGFAGCRTAVGEAVVTALGRAAMARVSAARLGLAPIGPRRERLPLWRRIDWLTFGSALVLSLLGSVLVWSATRPRLLESGGNPQAYLERHLLNLVLGVALGVLVAVIDYRMLRAYAPVIYVGSCIGLLAVLLVGATINGAHSWIVLGGGFQLQPSEFAKVALVIGMAMVFAERRTHEDVHRSADVPLVLALVAVPLGLVLLQPDAGTAMVFVFTALGVLGVAGVPARWILGLVLAGALAGGVAVQLHVLQSYQLDRFRVFTNPDANTQGAAYTITQARIAIGSGGLFGTGLFHGSQTNGKFVPEQHTDFVFTVAGEELGFAGAGGIILLFAILLWRALRIAGGSPDLFGRLVAVGVVAWFAFQTFVNIGMTLGIMPVTGLPLPFVSYGGSAMFANWMAVGLLLNVQLRQRAAEGGR